LLLSVSSNVVMNRSRYSSLLLHLFLQPARELTAFVDLVLELSDTLVLEIELALEVGAGLLWFGLDPPAVRSARRLSNAGRAKRLQTARAF
jgi:hypothetical protein